ncbi:unnamed protein product [marine sediment metagenome]|uniref:Uncharacterized protein n=1 Tax=marine sediment metagenome TaxID=412755 RepID=X0UED5_9ZZZZ
MNIGLEHITPETASSTEKWTAYISDKNSYSILKLTETEYNGFVYLQSQNKDLTKALEAIKKLTSDEGLPLMKALHEIAHKTLKALK